MHERAGTAVPEDLASEPPDIPPGWEGVLRDFGILNRQRRCGEVALPLTEDEMERQAERAGYDEDEYPEIREAWIALDDVFLEHARKEREKLFKK